MKRITSALLCFLVLISVTACGGNPAQSSSESAKSQSSAGAESGISSAAESGSPSAAESGSESKTESGTAVSEALPATVKVTIPEGFTFAQLCERLESKGVCTKEDLLKTVNSYDFSAYSLIAAQPANANRCFKLEGYLFPDTYEFYTGDKAQNALNRMLKNAENRIDDKLRAQAKQMGFTVDEVLALASIIEKEANSAEEMKNISSVFQNRLKSGQRLEADPTILYIEKYVKPYITGDKDRFNSYYNTYKCAALPAGPICNPGLNAINAVLAPNDTPYFFFVTDKTGKYYYSETFEEHQQNCKLAEDANAALAASSGA